MCSCMRVCRDELAERRSQSLGRSVAVDGCGYYASGISGTFTARIQSAESDVGKSLAVTRYSYR